MLTHVNVKVKLHSAYKNKLLRPPMHFFFDKIINLISQKLHRKLPFIVTFPFVIFRMLKPTVGIMSSLNCPD